MTIIKKEGEQIGLPKLGAIRIRKSRDLEGPIKRVGIDVGIKTFAVCLSSIMNKIKDLLKRFKNTCLLLNNEYTETSKTN